MQQLESLDAQIKRIESLLNTAQSQGKAVKDDMLPEEMVRDFFHFTREWEALNTNAESKNSDAYLKTRKSLSRARSLILKYKTDNIRYVPDQKATPIIDAIKRASDALESAGNTSHTQSVACILDWIFWRMALFRTFWTRDANGVRYNDAQFIDIIKKELTYHTGSVPNTRSRMLRNILEWYNRQNTPPTFSDLAEINRNRPTDNLVTALQWNTYIERFKTTRVDLEHVLEAFFAVDFMVGQGMTQSSLQDMDAMLNNVLNRKHSDTPAMKAAQKAIAQSIEEIAKIPDPVFKAMHIPVANRGGMIASLQAVRAHANKL